MADPSTVLGLGPLSLATVASGLRSTGTDDLWGPSKNLLLYVDPEHHFAINAVVRTPGRVGGVHDHADAWVLYGVLDGSESLERCKAHVCQSFGAES